MALCIAAAGCRTPPATLRADTLAYLQRVAAWAPTEAESARAVDRILATEFVDSAEVLRQIADDAPRVRRLISEAEAHEPRSTEVAQIHASYIAAWRDLLVAYAEVEEGLRSDDQRLLSNGRNGLAKWRDDILGVARELRNLKTQVGG